MTALGWIFGIGLPSIVGLACFAGAVAAWFRVPVLGHYIGLALALIGVGFVAHANGYSAAREACKEASVRAELAQAQADLSAAKAAAAQARDLGDRLNVSEARNLELAHALASRPIPDGCALSPADADGLRAIR
jgi:hypothetical protein